MLSRFLKRSSKIQYQGSELDKTAFSRLAFSQSWNNLVKSYDLRMWYLQNSDNHQKRWQYVLELENLQKEMNVHAANISTRRFFIMLLFFYFTVKFICAEPHFDWNNNWDPKFDRAIYGDLEDGGDEGGDDD